MKQINMMLMSDFYKQGHPEFYPDGQNYLFTCGTPRMTRLTGIDEMVVWGIQGFAQDYLIERFDDTFFKGPKEEKVQEVIDFINETFDCPSFNPQRIADIWDIGYLPVRLWAIPEGEMIPIINQEKNPGVVQVPFMAYENTNPKFAWVAEFLESITSCQTWYPMVIATINKKGYRDCVDRHWEKSVVGQPACTAISEFGFRGAEGSEGAIMASSAVLTSFNKTATVPAIKYLKDYYGKGMTLKEIGSGMSSTEHSVMCSNYAVDGNENDFMVKLFSKIAPSGNISCVADSYDYFGRLEEMGREGSPVKAAIMARNGCVFVRGDSGNPLHILCGKKKYTPVKSMGAVQEHAYMMENNDVPMNTVGYFRVPTGEGKPFQYVKVSKQLNGVMVEEVTPELSDIGTIEALYNAFGGYTNEKGYIVLNEKVKAIYGDSITPYLANEIYTWEEDNGFAANNVALGAGSFSMQAWEERDESGKVVLKPHTRDTFGIAFKATYCEINGQGYEIYKDPKTDTKKFKKSQRGMVVVLRDKNGKLYAKDHLTREEFYALQKENVMRPIFEDGKMLIVESLRDIRDRLHKGNF